MMPNYRNELVSFECELANETDKAWLLEIEAEQYWVPKSIGEFTPYRDADDVEGTLEVPTWWAEMEGLA